MLHRDSVSLNAMIIGYVHRDVHGGSVLFFSFLWNVVQKVENCLELL